MYGIGTLLKVYWNANLRWWNAS